MCYRHCRKCYLDCQEAEFRLQYDRVSVRKEGMKEMVYLTTHSTHFSTVIWRRTFQLVNISLYTEFFIFISVIY